MSERVKEIRERADKASPGPWLDEPASEEWKANGPANYDFCRHAREDIPFLLTELERVMKERDEIRAQWNQAARLWNIDSLKLDRENRDLRIALAHAKKVIDYHAACAPEHLKEISRIEAGGDGKE